MKRRSAESVHGEAFSLFNNGIGSLYVMAALADGPKHGYAVERWVVRTSGGDVNLRTGNTYSRLEALTERGLVVASPALEALTRATKIYDLSDHGIEVYNYAIPLFQRLIKPLRYIP